MRDINGLKLLYDRSSRDCLEDTLASILTWLGHRFELAYAASWDFRFDASGDSVLGSRIDAGIDLLRHGTALLARFQGIRLVPHPIADPDELLEICRQQFASGMPVVVRRGPDKRGGSPFLLATKLLEDNLLSLRYRIDGTLKASAERQMFAKDALHGWCGGCILTQLTVEARGPSRAEVESVAQKMLPATDGEGDIGRQMETFADQLETSLDLAAETRRAPDQFSVPLFFNLMRVAQGRNQYAHFLRYTTGLTGTAPRGCEPQGATATVLEELARKWNVVRSLLIKASISSGSTDIVARAVNRVRALAKEEKEICQGRRTIGSRGVTFTQETKSLAAGERERQLLAIWEQVFDREVGPDDDFFDLGGDSFSALDLAARAAELGLQISPELIYERQTVRLLTPRVQTAGTNEVNPVGNPGDVPLLPIQSQFFDLRRRFGVAPNPHHNVMAQMLEVSPRPDPRRVEEAVSALVEQHDSLRVRFVQQDTVWRQRIEPEAGPAPFQFFDLARLANPDASAAVEALSTEARTDLHLSDGPLIRIVQFRLAGDVPDRLLIVVHHGVCDGVSMRILIDELQQRVYGSSAMRSIPRTSVLRYATALDRLARSRALADESKYWLSLPWSKLKSLPVDNSGGSSLAYSCTSLCYEISPSWIKRLNKASRKRRMRSFDMVLTALAKTVAAWSESGTVAIHMTHHGRDAMADIDVTRTVGCLVCDFPAVLALDRSAGTDD